jgi:hypothetical protein
VLHSPSRAFASDFAFALAFAFAVLSECGGSTPLCLLWRRHLGGDFDVGVVFMFCSGRLAFQSGAFFLVSAVALVAATFARRTTAGTRCLCARRAALAFLPLFSLRRAFYGVRRLGAALPFAAPARVSGFVLANPDRNKVSGFVLANPDRNKVSGFVLANPDRNKVSGFVLANPDRNKISGFVLANPELKMPARGYATRQSPHEPCGNRGVLGSRSAANIEWSNSRSSEDRPPALNQDLPHFGPQV